MSSKALRIILNRCLTDKEFCERLLKNPEEAIKEYQLRKAEQEAILQSCTQSLRELVVWLTYLDLAGNYEDLA